MAGHRDKTRAAPAPIVSEPWSPTVLCVLPCCKGHMAQDRGLEKAQRPSGVEGPVVKGAVVTVGRGYLAVRSNICSIEDPEVGSIPIQCEGPSPRFGRRTPKRVCTPPCVRLSRRSMLRPPLCPAHCKTLCFRCGCAKLWRSKCLAWPLASGYQWPAHGDAGKRRSNSLNRIASCHDQHASGRLPERTAEALRFSPSLLVRKPDHLVSRDPNIHSGAHPALSWGERFWERRGS